MFCQSPCYCGANNLIVAYCYYRISDSPWSSALLKISLEYDVIHICTLGVLPSLMPCHSLYFCVQHNNFHSVRVHWRTLNLYPPRTHSYILNFLYSPFIPLSWSTFSKWFSFRPSDDRILKIYVHIHNDLFYCKHQMNSWLLLVDRGVVYQVNQDGSVSVAWGCGDDAQACLLASVTDWQTGRPRRPWLRQATRHE